MDIPWR